jgi:hypothetical protein
MISHLSYLIIVFIGLLSGAVIGFNLSLSISLFSLVREGSYLAEQIDFTVETSINWYLGIPIGGLAMSILGIYLVV